MALMMYALGLLSGVYLPRILIWLCGLGEPRARMNLDQLLASSDQEDAANREAQHRSPPEP